MANTSSTTSVLDFHPDLDFDVRFPPGTDSKSYSNPDSDPDFDAHPQKLAEYKESTICQTSALLNLPREVRDNIIKFVLAQENGVQVVIEAEPNTQPIMDIILPKGPSIRPPFFVQYPFKRSTKWPANRLKRVCRQLYNESRDATFEANDEIELICLRHSKPSVHELKLMFGQMSKSARRNLRRVVVVGNTWDEGFRRHETTHEDFPSFVESFGGVCEEYPHITFKLQFPAPSPWFNFAIGMNSAMRGPSALSDLLWNGQDPFAMYILETFALLFEDSTVTVPGNLRFEFDYEDYPEGHVERELQKYEEMGLVPSPEAMLEFKQAARRLFDEGF